MKYTGVELKRSCTASGLTSEAQQWGAALPGLTASAAMNSLRLAVCDED